MSVATPRRFKPYPKNKDSGVAWLGEIPAEWGPIRLKRLFKVVNGATPRSEVADYWGGGTPWVTPEDLGELRSPTIEDTRRRLTKAGYHSCGTSLVPAGSLVLSTRAPVGYLALAGTELCTNQGCRSLVFRRESDHTYFYFVLLAARPELESWGQGSTFKELAKSKLEDVFLSVPPLDEQSAIAAFLDRETARIDALVAKEERLIELLQEKRAALITRAVTRGLDPNVSMKDSGVEWLGEIPAHWEVRRLKTIAAVEPSNVDKKTVEGQEPVRLCNYVDVYYHDRITGDLEFMSATATPEQIWRFSLRLGDVLITKDSETPDDIAVPAVVAEDLPGVICGYHLALIRPKANIDGPFLARAFSAVGLRDQFHVAANGITRFGLTGDTVRSALFVLPPPDEQRTIAVFLDRETARIDLLIAKIRDAIDRLKELRTALISAAVTGKIDLRTEMNLASEALPQ